MDATQRSTLDDLSALVGQLIEYVSQAIVILDTERRGTDLRVRFSCLEELCRLAQDYADFKFLNPAAYDSALQLFDALHPIAAEFRDVPRSDLADGYCDLAYAYCDVMRVDTIETPENRNAAVVMANVFGLPCGSEWDDATLMRLVARGLNCFRAVVLCDRVWADVAGFGHTRPRRVLRHHVSLAFDKADYWTEQFRTIAKRLHEAIAYVDCCKRETLRPVPIRVPTAQIDPGDDGATTPDANRSNPAAAEIASRLTENAPAIVDIERIASDLVEAGPSAVDKWTRAKDFPPRASERGRKTYYRDDVLRWCVKHGKPLRKQGH